jgi:hypothetical protein
LEKRKISLHFSLNPKISVDKDLDGDKGRYLTGVASGLNEDAHGERVTANCIESLCRQAEEGDVLLFADQHGVKESEDIGLLKHFEVRPNGDWYVEFKLHDEKDKIDTASLEKANKLWAQVNGLSPYTKPREKGFSIEGYIPDDKILEDKKERLGIIDDMVLEGVVVVPKPAYHDSVIHAIYKSLEVTPPWKVQKDARRKLRSSLVRKDLAGAYDRERFEIEAARDELIREAVDRNLESTENLGEDLRLIFDEYKELAVELITKQPDFSGERVPALQAMADEKGPYQVRKSDRLTLLEELNSTLERLVKTRKETEHVGTN